MCVLQVLVYVFLRLCLTYFLCGGGCLLFPFLFSLSYSFISFRVLIFVVFLRLMLLSNRALGEVDAVCPFSFSFVFVLVSGLQIVLIHLPVVWSQYPPSYFISLSSVFSLV